MAYAKAAASLSAAAPNDNPLSCLELFAGAGGLALGLSRAGFVPQLVTDWDVRACATLRANADPPRSYTTNWPVRQQDVRRIKYADFDSIDLLSAGAPCQPFSQAGLGLGHQDSRNMFSEVLRAVRQLRPRAFILENVRGLVFPRSRPYFDYLLAQLHSPSITLGRYRTPERHRQVLDAVAEAEREYRVDWKLLNAADFGLPQNRIRLVIVGFRIDQQDSFVWPEISHSRVALLDALHGEEYWEHHQLPRRVRLATRQSIAKKPCPCVPRDNPNRWLTVRDLTKRLGPPGKQADDPWHMLVPGARLYAKHSGSPLDWPAKTVKAGVHSCPGGEHIVVDDSGKHRYLSVRECASLQGFPEDYALPEVRMHAMRQLGNAVPVNLAEAMGKQLARTLTNG